MASVWRSGSQFVKVWNATLSEHYEHLYPRPVWLDKSWQVVWNWTDRNQIHGIPLHHDKCGTYNSRDPITSLSFHHGGGVLTLGLHIGKEPTSMLFHENGDALIMAGDF